MIMQGTYIRREVTIRARPLSVSGISVAGSRGVEEGAGKKHGEVTLVGVVTGALFVPEIFRVVWRGIISVGSGG